MTRAALTELSVQKLKVGGKQKTHWDSSLPGFGVRVSTRSKSYVVMKGKERKLVTIGRVDSMTLKEARQEAMATILNKTPSKLPVGKLKERYLEEAEKRLSPKTYAEYEAYLEDFNLPLGTLSLAEVRLYLKTWEEHPTAQNYAFATVRAFLNWCLREGAITEHPLQRIPKPNRLDSRDRVLSDDELKAIWIHTDFRPFGHIVRCLMLSGARRLEIAHAKAEQVTDVFTIPDTKNREPHVLPLTPLLKEYLKPPFPFNSWSKAKDKLDTACGVENWTIHDLRRSFATLCAKHGVPVHVIERILNHKSGTISGVARTYNRYSYLKEMEEALLIVESHIVKITTPG